MKFELGFHYFISMAFQVLKKKLEKIIHQFKQIILWHVIN